MLNTIYSLLFEAYGKQGWWPVTPQGAATPEYTRGPTNDTQRFEVIVGAILTQNTAWKNVETAIEQLHQRGLMSIERILSVRKDTLARTIRSSGYFNAKAKKLKNVARFLIEHPIEELNSLPISKLRSLLLGVNGIGPETADSIILYAFAKPVFVVDAYTRRILSRIGIVGPDASYNHLQDLFHNELKRSSRSFNEYHALIVEHAKVACRKKPLCEVCVLADICDRQVDQALLTD